jgi:hypothetical protein
MKTLMEQTPIPTLFMRTVLQSLSMHPRLIGFVLNILQRLITKQVDIPLYQYCFMVHYTLEIYSICTRLITHEAIRNIDAVWETTGRQLAIGE